MKLKHTITEGGDELDFDDLDSKQQNLTHRRLL
jgi:hypothetical protein